MLNARASQLPTVTGSPGGSACRETVSENSRCGALSTAASSTPSGVLSDDTPLPPPSRTICAPLPASVTASAPARNAGAATSAATHAVLIPCRFIFVPSVRFAGTP
ncbi:MAG: hypothetical protein BWX70_01824 [Verrucomicrobia bacterium ADurb.Bin070]|nr:MAG: hypothetical protein BWX70_01824 [Verrucomicrobia bacterium ADurb.Bin070]